MIPCSRVASAELTHGMSATTSHPCQGHPDEIASKQTTDESGQETRMQHIEADDVVQQKRCRHQAPHGGEGWHIAVDANGLLDPSLLLPLAPVQQVRGGLHLWVQGFEDGPGSCRQCLSGPQGE